MNISSVSQTAAIAQTAVNMKAENFQLAYSTAVLKQMQDMQELIGDALVGMISQASAVMEGGVGTNLDICV
jgi:hypothetical protein